MLPLPTVSPIDTTEAALSDIERQRALKAPNIAGAVTDAVNTGLAVNKAAQDQADAQTARTDAQAARERAQWFQKNYVDQGWEGYNKAWQEAGSPAEADPRFVRKAVGDAPTDAFAFLHTVVDKNDAKKAISDYETALKDKTKTPEELSALAIAAGKSVSLEKGLEAIKSEADRTSREAYEAAKLKTAKTIADVRANATKTAASIRAALASATDAGVIAALTRENDLQDKWDADLKAIEDKRAAMTPSQVILDKSGDAEIARINREMAASNARVTGLVAKVRDVTKIPEHIRKPDSPTDDKNTIAEAAAATAAIAAGAPATAVYDRYLQTTGKRHPDDKRK